MNKKINKLAEELGLNSKEQDIPVIKGENIKNRVYDALGIISRENKFKNPIFKPAKIIAAVAAIVLIFGLLNITAVIAFFKDLFFVPGIGFTEGDISVVMLNEPVEISCDWGEVILEFVTKIKNSDGKFEILLYFTTKDEKVLSSIDLSESERELKNAKTAINGKIYVFNLDTWGGTYIPDIGYMGHLNMVNSDFPDINEFDLQFRDTTAHIVLTELNGNEKIPYISKETNGIKIAAYKFRNSNRIISLDVINNNDLGEFYTGTPNLYFDSVMGENDTEIKTIGTSEYSFTGWNKNGGNGFGYFITQLANKDNIDLTGIEISTGISIDYYPELIDRDISSKMVTTKPQIVIPIPKNGETIKTDIKIPVGGIIYQIIEVTRDGDALYYKDNSLEHNAKTFDMDSAIKNGEVYIGRMMPFLEQGTLEIYPEKNLIMGFDPGDDRLIINIRYISVIYFGDFSVDLTHN